MGTFGQTHTGVDEAGQEGPAGPWYWQGVRAIAMAMASTPACLLSEVSVNPPALTKADIVGVALAILAR